MIIEKHQDIYGNIKEMNQIKILQILNHSYQKLKVAGNTPDVDNKKNDEIAVPFKMFNNFWRALEMQLINFKINLILTWSENCVIFSTTGRTKFRITDTERYVPVVTLSTQGNIKFLKQSKSGFKRTIICININQK